MSPETTDSPLPPIRELRVADLRRALEECGIAMPRNAKKQALYNRLMLAMRVYAVMATDARRAK